MKICDQEVTPNIAAKKFWLEQLEVGFTNICSQEFDYQTGEDYKKLSFNEQVAIDNMVRKQYFRLRKLVETDGGVF
jgi:hypothetical protein